MQFDNTFFEVDMNKKEFIKEISNKTKFSKKECLMCVESIKSIIYDTLKRGEKINLVGFGKFLITTRKERKIINPQTGFEIVVPPQKIPTFKAGKMFKCAIR